MGLKNLVLGTEILILGLKNLVLRLKNEDLKAELEAELRVELQAELQAENQAKLPTASTEGRGPFSSTARTLPSQYEVISFTLVSQASREPFLVQRQAVLGPW